jgi:RND family efflux transporter MFP subunit
MNKIIFLLMAVILMSSRAEATNQTAFIEPKATSTGMVVPSRSVSLSAKVTGRIETVNFDEGDKVKQGDTLLTMDDAELKADLAHAKASVSLARVEFDHARRIAGRFQRLYKSKTVSEDQLDEASYGFQVAEEKLRVANADAAKVNALLKESRLIAPFDAVVTERRAEVGQLAQPGELLFVLEDHSQLKFRTRIKEKDVPKVERGQKIIVSVDALNDMRFEGKVIKIIPSGNASHTFVVEGTLPAVKKLYPGMFGKAEFCP